MSYVWLFPTWRHVSGSSRKLVWWALILKGSCWSLTDNSGSGFVSSRGVALCSGVIRLLYKSLSLSVKFFLVNTPIVLRKRRRRRRRKRRKRREIPAAAHHQHLKTVHWTQSWAAVVWTALTVMVFTRVICLRKLVLIHQLWLSEQQDPEPAFCF